MSYLLHHSSLARDGLVHEVALPASRSSGAGLKIDSGFH